MILFIKHFHGSNRFVKMTENNKDQTVPNRSHQRNILIVAAFVIFIEVIVFVSAATHSGKKNFLQITDQADQIIYEINGEHLSEFDKYYFENTFGPLEKFGKKIVTREVEFPFRAYFSAAAGLPLFLILLIAFAVKAYGSIFFQTEQPMDVQESITPEGASRYIALIKNLNIFVIGFILLLAVFLYWVIPNLFSYITKSSIDFVINYKWFFLGLTLFTGGIIIWIIYLKYLLAKKGLEIQKEITLKQIELGMTEKNTLIAVKDIKMIGQIDSDISQTE